MRCTLIAAALLLTACGGSDESVTLKDDNGKEVTVSTDGSGAGKTVIEGVDDSGKKVSAVIGGEGATWPAGAPAYAPAYPGATITSVMTTNAGSGEGGSMATFETADPPAKVIAFYKDLAAKAGLKESMTMNTGNASIFGAGTPGKGKGGLSVQASSEGGKTSGAVTFGGGAG